MVRRKVAEETTPTRESVEPTWVALSDADLFGKWIQTERGVVWYHCNERRRPRHHFFAIDL